MRKRSSYRPRHVNPTAHELRELLNYDPETGMFSWKPRPRESFARPCDATRFERRCAGRPVGGLNDKGYIAIAIHGRVYVAHRLAWVMITGEWPQGEIDHVNHVRSDNRFCNLRDVDRAVNMQNKVKALSNNRSGLLGVSARPGDRFAARIRVDGALLNLGNFATAEQAHTAYIQAKRKFHDGNTI